MAFATHAGVHILLRHVEEAKHVLGIGFGDFRRLAGPGVGIRHAFFSELHEHATCGHFFFRDGWRWRDELILRFQRIGVDGAAIDGDFIEPAIERMRGGQCGAAAEHERIAISDWCAIRLAAHVPHAIGFATVDVALDALELSERVGHRDVMPALQRHRFLRPPTMPVAFFAGNIGAVEEEADLSSALRRLEAKRVVLILRAELLRAQAAFADDVRRAAEAWSLHPRFESDGFIQSEAQCLAVGDLEGFFPFAEETDSRVLLGEAGIGRRTRSGFFCIIKAPLHGRRGNDFVRDVIARVAVVLREGSGGEDKETGEKLQVRGHVR